MSSAGRSSITSELRRRSTNRGSTPNLGRRGEAGPGKVGEWIDSSGVEGTLLTAMAGIGADLACGMKNSQVLTARGQKRILEPGGIALTELKSKKIATHPIIQPRCVHDKRPFCSWRYRKRSTQGLEGLFSQLLVQDNQCRVVSTEKLCLQPGGLWWREHIRQGKLPSLVSIVQSWRDSMLTMSARTARSLFFSIQSAHVAIHLFPSTVA
jgi:hypothetical protein